MDKERGYSIKKGKLEEWLKEHGFSLNDLAQRLGISERELQERLDDWDYWSAEEIESIVEFVGAKVAYEMIHFPTRKVRYQVKRKAFRRSRWAKRKD